MEKLAIIYNPVSGGGKARDTFNRLVTILKEKGCDFKEYASEEECASKKLAAQAVADGAEKVLVLGGDGTIREAAQSLVGTDTALGIIPCGSGNDLVRTLGIPTDPVAALEIALNGKARQMDAGKANGEWFFNVAGFGFDVDVLINEKKYHAISKNGSVAYMLGLFRSIIGMTFRDAEITWPEGSLKAKMLILAAGNGVCFGGGMRMCPGADPFDGKLDFCIVHSLRWYDVPVLLTKFLSGKHIKDTKHVLFFRSTELSVSCTPGSDLELDGEIMPGTPVTFKVCPKALRVMVPGE